MEDGDAVDPCSWNMVTCFIENLCYYLSFEGIVYSIVTQKKGVLKQFVMYSRTYPPIWMLSIDEEVKLELIPYSVISNLENKLNSSSFDNFGEIYGVSYEFNLLKSIIQYFRMLLLDLDGTEPHYQEWIASFKRRLFLVDDYFDHISATKFNRHKVRNYLSVSRLQVHCQIKRMLKDFYVINENHHKLRRIHVEHPMFLLVSDRYIGTCTTYSTWTIVSILVKHNINYVVDSPIAIVSLGIDKSFLARNVYNDDNIKSFFDKQVWIHVSDHYPDVHTLVDKILQDLTRDDEINDQGEQFHKDPLRPTRYLLVLDDIWNMSIAMWNQLSNIYLTCGAAPGSKILLTSSYPILEMLQPILNPIPRQSSRVIETADAIRFSGGKKDIMSCLRLSYEDMSLPLKQCFAYCSLYPKYWEIEKNELILLWMAQGYLESLIGDQSLIGEQQMEDLGNEYLNALLKKSVFQDVKFDEHGNVLSFKMHEFMHDIALAVAHNDFYMDREKRVNAPLHYWFSPESRKSLDASRLRTFYLQSEHVTKNNQIERKLSTILSFKPLRVLKLSGSSLKKLPGLIGRLQHLRYLDLSWCVRLTSVPKSICNLVNLQTLKLTGCERLEFSTKVVTKLINLRHLEIKQCKAFVDKMPIGLGKLSSLQSLSTFNVAGDDKKKKKKKEVAGKLNELHNLNNLRGDLEINGLDQVIDVKLESCDVNLADKKFLECLDLNWGPSRGKNIDDNNLQLLENLRPHQHLRRLNVEGYPGEQFCNWLSSIQHLSHISLFGFDNCKYLPPLEELPYLKSLSIGRMRVLEYIQVSPTAATFFPSLERLNISSCNKLRGWKLIEDKHQFPRLSKLMIYECPNLTCLPTFPPIEELESCKYTLKPLNNPPYNSETFKNTHSVDRPYPNY